VPDGRREPGEHRYVLCLCLARDPLRLVSRNGLTWLESIALSRFRWLAHGFSTRLGPPSADPGADPQRHNEFNLGLTAGAQPRLVEQNRRLFAATLGEFQVIASLHQIHSALVYQVASTASGRAEDVHLLLDYRPGGWPLPPTRQDGYNNEAALDKDPPGDALVTGETGVLLTVRVADCLPVLIADRRLRLVAAIHAGWRGALARIVEKTVGEMHRIFNSKPGDLVASLGPCIGPCCYEVGDEVVEAFTGRFAGAGSFLHKPPETDKLPDRYAVLFYHQAPPGHKRPRSKMHLDLAAAARAQLIAAGLEPSAIHGTSYCTACRGDLFFSHRRDGARAGRMMAAIGLR
jgi:polyphenol oxidase